MKMMSNVSLSGHKSYKAFLLNSQRLCFVTYVLTSGFQTLFGKFSLIVVMTIINPELDHLKLFIILKKEIITKLSAELCNKC